MNINLVSYTSTLDKLNQDYQVHQTLLNELELIYTINYFTHAELEHVPTDTFTLIFVATGGVEHLIVKDIEKLPRPIILLTDGLQNSLPAALEVSTWMRQRGIKNEILHGDIGYLKRRIDALSRNYTAQLKIKEERIGVIGTPSPWLLSSGVDYYLVKQRWGLNFNQIPLARVYDYFKQVSDKDVLEEINYLKQNALGCKGCSDKAIHNSMRFYKAVRRVCDEEQFTSITINCYKALEDIGVTGCLANSLLNDQGILTGCEGDLQSLFTLVMLRTLTGETGFMCNPNKIDINQNKLVLGHCSIGTNQVRDYIIRDHFATQNSVAIQGLLPLGESTLVKCGGECLDEYFVSSGSILENTNLEKTSRTEVLFKQDEPVSYFLKNPLGNHHILIRGDYQATIESFMENYSCKRVQ